MGFVYALHIHDIYIYIHKCICMYMYIYMCICICIYMYLLIVGANTYMYLLLVTSHYCFMRFAYVLHMRRQNLVLFFCLYIEPFELVIEIIFHCCTTPPCHKINLFKRQFWGSHFEHHDDAFVLLLVSLIFLYPQKILISVR